MKTLVLELSPESCQDALDELKKYQREISPKLDEVCRRLAELGAQEARMRFARGDHGNGGVTVTVEKIDNGYKIVASGHDVYFIEFGTGVNAGVGYGDSGVPATSVPVYPGSWSEQHAQEFSRYGYWWWQGEKLQGTEAEMPMYYAGKAIRENEIRIAREVFSK